jgi:hypothetical protein
MVRKMEKIDAVKGASLMQGIAWTQEEKSS